MTKNTFKLALFGVLTTLCYAQVLPSDDDTNRIAARAFLQEKLDQKKFKFNLKNRSI